MVAHMPFLVLFSIFFFQMLQRVDVVLQRLRRVKADLRPRRLRRFPRVMRCMPNKLSGTNACATAEPPRRVRWRR